MRISDWISDVCSSDLKFWIFISRSANAFDRPSFRYSNRSGDYGADAALGEGLAALKRPAGDLGGVGYPSRIFFRTPSEPVWERQFFVAAMPSVDCRSEEHTSELQSLMRISYAVFCLKNKTKNKTSKQ